MNFQSSMDLDQFLLLLKQMQQHENPKNDNNHNRRLPSIDQSIQQNKTKQKNDGHLKILSKVNERKKL